MYEKVAMTLFRIGVDIAGAGTQVILLKVHGDLRLFALFTTSAGNKIKP